MSNCLCRERAWLRAARRGRLRKAKLQILRSHSTWIRHIVERQRHVNGEDAACTRYIPNVDVAFVCPDRLARNGQPETQPRAILPSPLTERLKRVTQGGRDTPALVFHLDQEACAVGADTQHHLASGTRVFERIVQQVR